MRDSSTPPTPPTPPTPLALPALACQTARTAAPGRRSPRVHVSSPPAPPHPRVAAQGAQSTEYVQALASLPETTPVTSCPPACPPAFQLLCGAVARARAPTCPAGVGARGGLPSRHYPKHRCARLRGESTHALCLTARLCLCYENTRHHNDARHCLAPQAVTRFYRAERGLLLQGEMGSAEDVPPQPHKGCA